MYSSIILNQAESSLGKVTELQLSNQTRSSTKNKESDQLMAGSQSGCLLTQLLLLQHAGLQMKLSPGTPFHNNEIKGHYGVVMTCLSNPNQVSRLLVDQPSRIGNVSNIRLTLYDRVYYRHRAVLTNSQRFQRARTRIVKSLNIKNTFSAHSPLIVV